MEHPHCAPCRPEQPCRNPTKLKPSPAGSALTRASPPPAGRSSPSSPAGPSRTTNATPSPNIPRPTAPPTMLFCQWRHPGGRRGQKDHAWAAERADAGTALLRGRNRQSPDVRRLPCPVPLLDQWRSHLVPRPPSPPEPLPPGGRLPHPGRSEGDAAAATSTPDAGWSDATPNDHPWLRPYQTDANAAIEDAIAEQKRQMLVAMATGPARRSPSSTRSTA